MGKSSDINNLWLFETRWLLPINSSSGTKCRDQVRKKGWRDAFTLPGWWNVNDKRCYQHFYIAKIFAAILAWSYLLSLARQWPTSFLVPRNSLQAKISHSLRTYSRRSRLKELLGHQILKPGVGQSVSQRERWELRLQNQLRYTSHF